MKCFFKITISLLVVFLIDQSATAQYKNKDFNKVSQIFMQQEKDWNDGNIDAFMTSYLLAVGLFNERLMLQVDTFYSSGERSRGNG